MDSFMYLADIEDGNRLRLLLHEIGYDKNPACFVASHPYEGLAPDSLHRPTCRNFNKEEIYDYKEISLLQAIKIVCDRHKNKLTIIRKHFPELFFSDAKYTKLIRAAEKSKGKKRNVLYRKANKIYRKLNAQHSGTIYF